MINRRKFLKYSSASFGGSVLLNSCNLQSKNASENKGDNRPNIIVLIADDLRGDCLGVFNTIIETPNIDLLAKQGTVFHNNFVTTSICPTSRASIFTGLYARSHGIWDFETALNKEQLGNTYPYLLKQADYSSAFIGKWGLGGELPENDFDYWGGFPGQGNYYTKDRKEHLDSYLTGQAEDFIAGQTKHFCLTLSYKAPHVEDDSNEPFFPDTKFVHQYQDTTIPRYQNQEFSPLPVFLQNTEAQIRYEKLFRTEKLYQKSVKNYYRLISGIDESIGRIVQAVKEKNFDQETYIIFTSDNGFFLGEKGLAGKWFGFEPAIRTPLIISRVKQTQASSTKVTDMTLNIDLAPTIVALGGVEPKTSLFQGRNLLNIFSTLKEKPREWWFYEHLLEHPFIPRNVGIRGRRYKYLSFPQHNHEMLFDLEQDPQENSNLAQEASFKTLLRKYRQLVQQSERSLGK